MLNFNLRLVKSMGFSTGGTQGKREIEKQPLTAEARHDTMDTANPIGQRCLLWGESQSKSSRGTFL